MEIGHAHGSSQYLGLNFLATPGLHVTTFHNLATALRKYGSKGKRRDRNRCYEDETQSVFEIITQPMQLFLELNFLGRAPWKRNQVFERVFCADVQICHASIAAAAPATPPPPPSKRPAGIWKVLLPRGLWHAGRIVRGDMLHVMHMWAPRGRLMSMCTCGEVVCGISFVLGLIICSELRRQSPIPMADSGARKVCAS